MGRSLAVAAALGAIATWGSENLFWVARPDGLTATGWLVTWAIYSLAAAAALSAVVWTRVQGWRAAFLGGCLLGLLIEGVVVDTVYAAFPLQVLWTPIAWHGVVTGLAVLGLSRAGAHWPVTRLALAWTALGVGAGVFGWYWPIERGAMPSIGTEVAYLLALGLVVPAASLVLDRVGRLEVNRRSGLLVAPILLGVVWAAKAVLVPSPVKLALPLLVAGLVWLMRRGGSDAPALTLGSPAPTRRHGVFLLAPLATLATAQVGWWAAPGGVQTNVAVALALQAAGLVLLGRAAWPVRSPAGGTASSG